ncbi:hypothetical protein GCM10007941_02850 [Amphritea balenae]|nr:hypothetical protein GCM10007941_02850 [Amphritea balenae]
MASHFDYRGEVLRRQSGNAFSFTLATHKFPSSNLAAKRSAICVALLAGHNQVADELIIAAVVDAVLKITTIVR